MKWDNQEEFIREVKKRNDLVSVVSEYVSLKKKGKSLWGLCPFHSEKTPSFQVDQEKQFYYCFGCRAGGDVINFIMELEKFSFSQALKWLAERANIPFQLQETPTDRRLREEREWLYRLNKLAATYYQKVLRNSAAGKKAVDYLIARGIKNEIADKFLLGYAPQSWTGLVDILKKKGLSLNKAEKAGLVLGGAEGFYDRFRGRLIFPITTPRGRVVAFGARILGEGGPKYLNSPDTPIFHKGRYLYGLYQAGEAIRKMNLAVITEGYMDVIQTHQAGIEYVIASLGTALTLEQIRTLKRYTQNVIMAFDSDAPGQAATVRGLDLLRDSGMNVRVAALPPEEDPDSMVRTKGPEAFLEMIRNSKDLFVYKVEQVLKVHDLKTPIGKAQAVKEVLPFLAEVGNMVARETYIKELAGKIGVSEEAVYGEWRSYWYNKRKNKQRLDIKEESRYTKDTNFTPQKTIEGISGKDGVEIRQLEREVLRGCLQEKDNLARIKESLSGIEWTVPEHEALYRKLIQVYHNLEVWPPPEEEIEAELRGFFTALLAENELTSLSVDLEGCSQRIRRNRLAIEIQRIEEEIAATTEQKKEGETSSSDELEKKLSLLNELHRRLREEFPSFSGLL